MGTALQKILRNQEHLLRKVTFLYIHFAHSAQRLEGASSPKEFLVELADLVVRTLSPSVPSSHEPTPRAQEKLTAGKRASAPPPPPFYSQLVRELDELGWDRLVHLDASLTTLTLRVLCVSIVVVLDGSERVYSPSRSQ